MKMTMYSVAPRSRRMRAGDGVVLALIVALHGGLIGVVWFTPTHAVPDSQPVLMAALIPASPPPEISPPKPPEPPKPLPVKPKPVVKKAPPPVLTAAPAPAVETTVTAPEPVPVPVEPAPPEPQPPVAAAVEPAPAAVAAPPPVIPPRFDADYLDNPAPPYPPLSRRLREQGTVLLRVYVENTGLPGAVELKQSSGHTRLDDVALNTVKRWRFVPARQNDTAVAGWVVVPITFNLRS